MQVFLYNTNEVPELILLVIKDQSLLAIFHWFAADQSMIKVIYQDGYNLVKIKIWIRFTKVTIRFSLVLLDSIE